MMKRGEIVKQNKVKWLLQKIIHTILRNFEKEVIMERTSKI